MSTLSWWGQPHQTGPIAIQQPITTQEAEYYWDWGTAPQSIAVSTTATTILSATNEPRLVSYRVDADPAIKLKIWKNAPTTGDYELDSFGGHNIEKWELSSGLKIATVAGTANVIVNTASRVVI